ncbi:MAG TPA: hypothetical protein DIS68_05595 [Lachnospiraceae bacterium]|nr:hypothetical protein [Lachnospiraceae bacterium]
MTEEHTKRSLIDTAIALIIVRTEAYLSDTGSPAPLREYPVLREAAGSLSDADLKRWAEATGERKKGRSKKDGDTPEGRYLRALEMLDNAPVLQTLMELCAAVFTYPEFSAYLESAFGYGPCLHLACLIEGSAAPGYEEIHRYALIARRLLVLDLKAEPLQYAPVMADERLMGYLAGRDEVGNLLSDFTTLYGREADTLHEPFVNEELIERGAAHLKDRGRMLALTGRGGRRFIAKQIAGALGWDLILLNISGLMRRAEKDGMTTLRDALIREAYFDTAGICIYGFDEYFITGGIPDRERGRRDMEALSGMLFEPIVKEGIPLIICVDEAKLIPDMEGRMGLAILSMPASYSYDDRKRMWQGLFDINGLTLDAASFASRYRMNPAEAARAVAAYGERYGREAGEEDTEQDFARISIEDIRNREAGVGRIVYSDVRLNDVKLKDSVKQVLLDAVNAVLSGPVVLDEWGLRKNYPYGKGVSLLMAGPPGTGKTMSANAIAGELSLPLYQVNLSNTVDKYIGETEKNLEKAFSFAEKNNVILFFDEADALFGTRSEVHDSKDRYANTEISYLLQRMEAYDGIVLMATNIKGNIDPAFMRRIRYVAHFENPDEEMRRAIWEGCFGEGVPHEEIDIDYLAAQFDKFTGSIIKTVFLNACARAAGAGEKLTMKHLVYAIRQETEKESAVGFTMETLGKYAYLI